MDIQAPGFSPARGYRCGFYSHAAEKEGWRRITYYFIWRENDSISFVKTVTKTAF